MTRNQLILANNIINSIIIRIIYDKFIIIFLINANHVRKNIILLNISL